MLKVGETYTTKNGNTVRIISSQGEYVRDYPYIGECVEHLLLLYYSKEGECYNHGGWDTAPALEPYDWGADGADAHQLVTTFIKVASPEARDLAIKQVNFITLLLYLKKSLGEERYEFTPDTKNYRVFYSHHTKNWGSGYEYNGQFHEVVYFKSKDNANKVADYLNKHYPDGRYT